MQAPSSKRRAERKRRKPHQLPKFPPNNYSWPEVPDANGECNKPPDKASVDALAQKHGFQPDFNLRKELFERWFWWRFEIVTGRLPSATVQKEFLRELASRARAIEEGIDQLPDILRTMICGSVGGPEPLDLDRLKHLAHLLRNGCFFAQKKIPPSRRGARGNPELTQLLMKLYRLYREAFGAKAARITKADRYSGKFFAFANDVLRSFGVQKSNYGLGKAIQRAIAEVERRDRKNPQNTAER